MIEQNQWRWLRTYGCIALILGVTCSAVGTRARIRQDSNQVSRNSESTSASSPEGSKTLKKKFKLLVIGNGRTNDGSPLTTFRFKGPDGKIAVTYFVRFDSKERAAREMRRALMGSIRTVSTSPKTDEHGNIVGTRTLALFRSAPGNEYETRLVWTAEADFHEIVSVSSDDVMDLEKMDKSIEIVK